MLTFWLGLIAFLLPSTACSTAGLGSVGKLPFPLFRIHLDSSTCHLCRSGAVQSVGGFSSGHVGIWIGSGDGISVVGIMEIVALGIRDAGMQPIA